MSESPTSDARLISKSKLESLLEDVTTQAGKAEAATGRIGGIISTAVEKDNLHRKAFGLLRQCVRMDPVKLHAFLANWDKYREDLDLDKQAGETLPLDENVDPKARSKDKRGSTKRKARGDAAKDDETKGEGGGTVSSLDQRRAERKAAAADK